MSFLGVSIKRLIHPVTLAFTILIVVGIALGWLIRAQRDDHFWVQHTMEVREAIEATRLAVSQAESGMRGFLITGRDDYLAPYTAARDILPLQVSNIRRLTTDNPDQQANINKLQPTIDKLLAVLQQRIDTARNEGQAAAFAAMTGISKELADQASAILGSMAVTESTLLTQRQSADERTAVIVQVLVMTVLVTALAFGLLSAIEGSRRRKEIESGHSALLAAHERLNDEVKERESVELQLRQSQKMEAVGQLTGGIAHDFNNMLAVVIGALDIARKRLIEGDHNVSSFLDSAIDGAKRGALLTQRLLAFSRQQALAPAVLNPNKLVSGLSDLLRRTLGENIVLEVVLGAGLWRVFADAHQLENALVNLAVNARDAMPQGGRLTIETENTTLDQRYAAEHGVAAGSYVMISITDTGMGMAPDVMARAFDPFFTTKPVGQGTGLGLSQVFGFVKQSGGHIKIYSELNRGTTVKVYLLRSEQEDLAASTEAVSALPPKITDAHHKAVILAVEDDDTVRLLTVASLEELGYDVVSANGAKEALRILETRHDIELLVTDVVMPEVTGRQLAEEAVKRMPRLKVLFTTDYTRNAIVHNGTLDAGVHLLSKPFTLQQLSAAVNRVLDG